MKKYLFILITLLITVSLFGCSVQKQSETTLLTQTTATAVSETQSTTSVTTEQSTTESTTAVTTTATTTTTTAHRSATVVLETEKVTTEKKTAAKKTTAKATAKKTTAKPKTTRAKTTTASTTAATTSSEITCTVEIECKTILGNMSDLKAGKEKYVPDSGVILSEYEVTLSEGSNVYLALDRACEENNIPLAAQKSIYGVYISGINYLYEKDCGSKSGWLYSVNGTQPNISASSYTLQNGDKVVFSYTCTY